MSRPASGDAAQFYHRYINLVKGNNFCEAMASYSDELKEFYNSLPEEKAGYAYEPGKWTVKELLQHVMDAERIFSYRALRISRKDTTPLSSFDENLFAKNANANSRNLQSLKDEFNAVRLATDLLFTSFNEDQFNTTGISGGQHVTVNALAFITYGHLLHPQTVLKEKYLQ